MNKAFSLGHAFRGAVPVMMTIDRERENKRRFDVQEARAGEEFNMRKQSHGALMAQTGLQTLKLQQQQEDDQKLRDHLLGWRDNRQKIQQGDFAPFMEGLAEYNSNQGWAADGYSMKPRQTESGTILDRHDANGKLVESSPPMTRGEVLKLYDLGMAEKMKFFNPARYDQFIAGVTARQAKLEERRSREKIADSKNETSLKVAGINQGGADRRHAGTLAVQRDRLEWDKVRPSGGLTLSQQRQNEEIAAARDMVTGLTDEEIRQRTAPTTATGRENPDFDPSLARAAKLASRRLIGEDPQFDQRNRGAQTVQASATNGKPAGTPIERAQAALAADPALAGFSLGKQTMKGFEVFDADGNLRGHLGK
jgi:hypothetical protein